MGYYTQVEIPSPKKWPNDTLFQIISNTFTSSLLTFSVIYTFYFYIASEGLKIYQKYVKKKVPDFPFLEKFIRDNNDYLRNSFLEGLSNFSLLLLLFDSSNLVSRATWGNELNQVIQTQAKILSLTEKNRPVVLNRFPFSEAKGSMFYFKKTYWVSSLRSKKSWIRARRYLTHHTWKW